MNKRLIKKKMKKKEQFNGFICADGNNGGDFIEIEHLGNGLLNLRSGHCCVMSVDATVPVEFITALLSDMMTEHDNSISAVIDSFGWDKEFKSILKAKVRDRW